MILLAYVFFLSLLLCTASDTGNTRTTTTSTMSSAVHHECSPAWCLHICHSTVMDKCCRYENAAAVVVMVPAHPLALNPLKEFASKFSTCTKASISFVEVPMGDWSKEVENDVTTTRIYDGYILKSIWYQTYADQLEDLTPRIQATPELEFLDIAYVVRSELAAINGTVLTIPIDADASVFMSRRDLQMAEDKLDTIEQLLAFAKRHDGKDLNADGIPDYGVCIPSHRSNALFAKLGMFVSPLVQSKGSSQGLFFDSDTFTPLVNTTAWIKGLRYAQAAVAMSQYREEGPRDWQTENAKFREGRCSVYIDLPGLLKKVAIEGISRKDTTGNVIWTAPAAAQRHKTPGSHQVMVTEVRKDANGMETRAYEIYNCQDVTGICPYAVDGVSRSPFFGTGGFSMSIRKGAPVANKDLLWDFIVFVNHPDQSTVVATQTGFLDAWRNSHLAEMSRQKYIETGWNSMYLDEHFEVSSWIMSEQANAAMDLRIRGSAQYINALETRFEQSTGWIQNAAGTYEKVDHPPDLADAAAMLVEDWARITSENGGRLSQAELYRKTLGMTPMSLKTKCVHFKQDMARNAPRFCDSFLKGVCKAGFYLDFSSAPPTCEPCLPGYYSAKGTDYLGGCTACPRGYFSGPRAPQCSPCGPGSFQNLEGQANCTSCQIGKFNPGTGQAQCALCTKGTYSNEIGSLQCSRCPLARYQLFVGSASCNFCATGLTTLEVGSEEKRECVCLSGTYHDCGGPTNLSCFLGDQDSDLPGFCQPCPVGMLCEGRVERATAMVSIEGGRKLHRLPLLQPGRMAIGKVTYACAGDGLACPGASLYDSFDVMCAFGGTGVACAECSKDASFSRSQCIRCTAQSRPIVFFFVLFVLFVGLCKTLPAEPLGVYTERTAIKSSYDAMVSANAAHILDLIQTTMIYVRMNVQWPMLVETIFSMSDSVFALTGFGLECTRARSRFGKREFALVKVAWLNAAPGVACLYFGMMFVIATVGFREGRLCFPDRNKIFSQVLSLLATFFVTIVNAAVNYGYAVMPHPGGKLYSIRAFPFILTTDSEADPIRLVSLAGFLLWCVGGLSIFAYILWQLPNRVTDHIFRLRSLSIVQAFKIETPWWMLVKLVKNFVVVLVLSIFTKGAWQCAYVSTVLVIYLVALVSFKPYYSPLCYYTDLVVSSGKLFILITFNVSEDSTEGELVVTFAVCATYLFAVASLFLSAFLWIRGRLLKQTVDIEHFGENPISRLTNRLSIETSLQDLLRHHASAPSNEVSAATDGYNSPGPDEDNSTNVGVAGETLLSDVKEDDSRPSALKAANLTYNLDKAVMEETTMSI